MGNVLSEMRFGRIESGLVRLGINGQIAIKIGTDYKYYNPTKKRLVNCDQFVFDVGSEFFFIMPTNKVKTGDIIIAAGKPAYVLAPENADGEIKILSYEDSSIKTILPERHTFLGEAYMYHKIVSLLGNKTFDKNTLMKYMMMNSMLGGSNGKASGGIFGGMGSNPMMLMMMMGGNNPFSSMFDFGDDAEGLFGNLLGGLDADEAEGKAEAKESE